MIVCNLCLIRDVPGSNLILFMETTETEVKDTSCRGSVGVPQIKNFPKTGGYRGLIKTISAVAYIIIKQA